MSRIAVLGTGTVGKAVGSKLTEVGHEVKMGTRSEGTYADAAAFGEIVVNATPGTASLDALAAAVDAAVTSGVTALACADASPVSIVLCGIALSRSRRLRKKSEMPIAADRIARPL